MFQDELERAEAKLRQVQQENAQQERDKTRISGELRSQLQKTQAVERALEQERNVIGGLKRDLGKAMARGADADNANSARIEAETKLQNLQDAHTAALDALQLCEQKARELADECANLTAERNQLEAELAPTRKLVHALREQVAAVSVIQVESQKLPVG